MVTIDINTEVQTHSEMADVLEMIARKIKEGYTSGYDPTWSLAGEEEAG